MNNLAVGEILNLIFWGLVGLGTLATFIYWLLMKLGIAE